MDSDGFNRFTLLFVEVLDKFLAIVLFLFNDDWWLVYFEFLILRGVGVIEGPLSCVKIYTTIANRRKDK